MEVRRPPQHAQIDILSDKQIEVVEFRAQGWTNKEIAEMLNCSESTIYTHWNRIKAKTGCRDHEEVIAMLVGQTHKPRGRTVRPIYDRIEKAVQRLYLE